MGRVLGTDGRPVSEAQVEIWQCDAHGRYLHPADTGKRPRDSAFQGYGRMTSSADGAYRFRTIRPVAYPGRTPHIHFAVSPPGGRRLITQMYIAGEPLNQSDGLYASIRDSRQRDAVTVALTAADGIEREPSPACSTLSFRLEAAQDCSLARTSAVRETCGEPDASASSPGVAVWEPPASRIRGVRFGHRTSQSCYRSHSA